MVRSKILIGSLVAVTSLSAFVLMSTTASADGEPYSETYTKSALIRVASACTLSGAVATPHTKSVAISTYESNIGETVFSGVCNDSGGFAVYAIGYSNDTDGNTKLIHSTDNSIFINTGTAESGNTSAWAMKLTAVENAATPTIHNGYTNYSVVPNEYVKVASYPSVTTASASSMFKSYYAVYVSPTQPAGTYEGKVKYVMVHPSTAAAPTFDNAFATAGKTKDVTSNKYKMQDMNTQICDSVAEGATTELVDTRDGTVYHVGKMLDGRCWLLDNLALDAVATKAVLSPENTNATQAAIDNFVTSSGTAPQAGWTTVAVSYGGNGDYDWDKPFINITKKNDVPQGSDPLQNLASMYDWKTGIYYDYCAASVGTYCYTVNGGQDTDSTSAIDVKNDICPAGWRMPTGGAVSSTGTTTGGGEYQNLYDQYTGNVDITGDTSEGSRYYNFRFALRLPLSGAFFGDQFWNYFGNAARFWSSTYSSSQDMHSLRVENHADRYVEDEFEEGEWHWEYSVYTNFPNGRAGYLTIRCISK